MYPIRWYYLLSTWIFLLSVLYPLHRISTFPLNLMALVGCYECLRNPFGEHWFKTLYILFIHLAPFLWIPYELSVRTLLFALCVILIYLFFIGLIKKNPIDVYDILLKEKHEELHEFLADRFAMQR